MRTAIDAPARGAARLVSCSLALSVTAAAWADGGNAAHVRDTRFDADAEIPCAQNPGEEMGVCEAAIARGAPGDATVLVTFSNGFSRRLFFRRGAFVSADATMSGTGTDVSWRRENGVYRIRVDDQRYELSAAFVLGE